MLDYLHRLLLRPKTTTASTLPRFALASPNTRAYGSRPATRFALRRAAASRLAAAVTPGSATWIPPACLGIRNGATKAGGAGLTTSTSRASAAGMDPTSRGFIGRIALHPLRSHHRHEGRARNAALQERSRRERTLELGLRHLQR